MNTPLQDIQDNVLERLHAGEELDREAICAAHPEHAQPLGAFLDLLDLIEAGPDSRAIPARLGDFRIVRELGRGGMGVVYEAQQVSLKRAVALKVLPAALRTDVRLLARFRREAEAAGRLRHPGIVPVYSVGEQAGAPFFAMELVDGCSLEAILRDLRAGRAERVPADPAERRAWAVETIARVADALAYAHAQGVLHRDVKPGNVLLESDGTPRLTDFGLALDLHAPGLTLAGEVFGSPHYMSPEQAVRREQPIDARTDIYSLGVTLYELLTLRLPYEASTVQQVLTALSTGKVLDPRRVDASIPEPLAAVVMKALRRDPSARYSDALAFAADLRAAVRGEPVEAMVAPPRRRFPWSRLVRVAAVGIVALAGAGGIFHLATRHTPNYDAQDQLGHPSALTFDLYERLAADEDPDAAARIERAMTFTVDLRSVISRADALDYEVETSWKQLNIGRTHDPVAVFVRWEVSVNDGDWRWLTGTAESLGPHSSAWSRMSPAERSKVEAFNPFLPRTRREFARPSIHEALGSALAADSVTIRHRAVVEFARPMPGSVEGFALAELDAETGATFVWTGEEQELRIVEEYSPLYPAAVDSDDLAPAVSRALQLESVAILNAIGWPPVGREPDDPRPRVDPVRLRYELPNELCPVDVVADLLVYVPGDDQPIARDRVVIRADRPGKRAGRDLRLIAPTDAPERVERIVKSLWSGEIGTVRLVFRPSRTRALELPGIDSYWGRPMSIDVPVRNPLREDGSRPW